MTNLYITQQGAAVRKLGQALLVEKNGEQLLCKPMKDLQCLVVLGQVQVSTQAMLSLLDQGCQISLLTQNGHFRGSVIPAYGKNVTLRVGQYEHFRETQNRLRLSRSVVHAKVRNGIRLLRDYHYSAHNPVRVENLEEFPALLSRITLADNQPSLRGYEGSAARLYFRSLAACLTGEVRFEGRHYYPAPDPVNALLSLGYSFVQRELQSLLQALGMDPYIGFYHEIEYGRPSLSLDLLEPFRTAVVDRLSLRLFNKRILTAEDFYWDEERKGCYLQQDAFKTYIRHYEQFVGQPEHDWQGRPGMSFRDIFRSQVETLRGEIQGGETYEPYEEDFT